jgi:hypothetical protein
VGLDRAFQHLCDCARRLQDNLVALQVTIREDFPRHGGVVLVDHFGDAVDDCLGWLEEAFAAAMEARRAVGHPVDVDKARRALTMCQERFNRTAHRFSCDLVSYEKLNDLTGFAKRRQGEWIGWVKSVKKGLEESRGPLDTLGAALVDCWQEVAERAGTTCVSVQTTTIGQQFTPKSSIDEQPVHEEIL